jgi:hypothetical protein
MRWENGSARAGTVPGTRRIFLDMTHRIETMVDGTPLFTWLYQPRGGDGGPFPNGAVLPPRKLADGTFAPDQLLRRHWASVFPERVLTVFESERVEITLTNLLDQPHNFTIREEDLLRQGGFRYVDSGPLPPGMTKTFDLPPLSPGTYIFEDDLDTDPRFQVHPEDHGGVNRSLGLHGVLVVSPDDPWTLISGPPNEPSPPSAGRELVEFERQYVWILNDHDPAWNALAQQGRANEIDISTHLPSYFTINGRAGIDCVEGSGAGMDTRPCGKARDRQRDPGQVVRIVNVGVEIHGVHFHGNHVQIVRGALPFNFKFGDPVEFVPHLALKDTVPLHPRDRVDVILPFELPRDCATPPGPGQELHYPMHSHSEPSQTAGGGLYPGGQLTDWILLT